MFCKSGIFIFIFAENNYSIYAHAVLIKTPLLHQSFGPHVSFCLSVFLFLSFSLSLYFWLIPWNAKAGCVTQGILASFLLSLSHSWLQTTRFQSIKGSTEISSLSHSIVFLYFFALISEEGFLISPCYSLKLYIQVDLASFSPLPFTSLLFSAICKTSSENHFAFLHFFLLRMVLITASCKMLRTFVHSSLCTLSDVIPWIYLLLPLYNHKGFDLGHTWMF